MELAVSATIGSAQYTKNDAEEIGSNSRDSGPNYVIDGPDSDDENDHPI